MIVKRTIWHFTLPPVHATNATYKVNKWPYAVQRHSLCAVWHACTVEFDSSVELHVRHAWSASEEIHLSWLMSCKGLGTAITSTYEELQFQCKNEYYSRPRITVLRIWLIAALFGCYLVYGLANSFTQNCACLISYASFPCLVRRRARSSWKMRDTPPGCPVFYWKYVCPWAHHGKVPAKPLQSKPLQFVASKHRSFSNKKTYLRVFMQTPEVLH